MDDLLGKPLPLGSIVLVFYDSASLWYETCVSIAAEYLRGGGLLSFVITSRLVQQVRSQLEALGVNARELESSGKLDLEDWYSATLGQKSPERSYASSVKVADLSVSFVKQARLGEEYGMAGWLAMADDLSVLDRFNEERSWVELMLTRVFPVIHVSNFQAEIAPFMREVHSERAYRQLEGAADVIIDLKLDESGAETKNLIRVRRARNMVVDSKWRQLRQKANSQIELT